MTHTTPVTYTFSEVIRTLLLLCNEKPCAYGCLTNTMYFKHYLDLVKLRRSEEVYNSRTIAIILSTAKHYLKISKEKKSFMGKQIEKNFITKR